MLKSLLACCLGASVLMTSFCASAEISIIPEPQHIEAGHGSYQLDTNTGIDAPDDARAHEIVSFLRDAVRDQTGIRLSESVHAHGIEIGRAHV